MAVNVTEDSDGTDSDHCKPGVSYHHVGTGDGYMGREELRGWCVELRRSSAMVWVVDGR